MGPQGSFTAPRPLHLEADSRDLQAAETRGRQGKECEEAFAAEGIPAADWRQGETRSGEPPPRAFIQIGFPNSVAGR